MKLSDREAGATTVMASMVMAFIMLVVGSLVVLTLGGATSEKRQAQSAADAAGLAAMDEVATGWRDVLLDGFDSEEDLRWRLLAKVTPCAGASLARAQSFAGRNAATVTGCSWNAGTGEVTVAVRSADSQVSDTSRAASRSSAALSLDLRKCTLEGDVLPTPTPTPTPTPDPAPTDPPEEEPTPSPPPEPVEGWLRCGSTTFKVQRVTPDALIRIIPPGQVKKDLTEAILTS